MNASTDESRKYSLRFTDPQPSLAGAPAVGAVRLFGEKPQESKRPPRLLAGLRRLEDDPLDDEQALARFTEGDLDPAQLVLIKSAAA